MITRLHSQSWWDMTFQDNQSRQPKLRIAGVRTSVRPALNGTDWNRVKKWEQRPALTTPDLHTS